MDGGIKKILPALTSSCLPRNNTKKDNDMALSDIGLASRALIRIGARPISSFSDGTAESEIAGALFPPVRDALLSAYGWSFATAQAELNQLNQAPLADYDNAFALPVNFLRALSAGSGAQARGLNYRIAQDSLHANTDRVVLSYIFQPAEEAFPPYFDAAIIARLAAELTVPLTENTSRSEAMFRLAEDEFARARQIDAQQDTPGRLQDFSLVDVRS
jgi:hypothetical protein